jgi:hypothetical protein
MALEELDLELGSTEIPGGINALITEAENG